MSLNTEPMEDIDMDDIEDLDVGDSELAAREWLESLGFKVLAKEETDTGLTASKSTQRNMASQYYWKFAEDVKSRRAPLQPAIAETQEPPDLKEHPPRGTQLDVLVQNELRKVIKRWMEEKEPIHIPKDWLDEPPPSHTRSQQEQATVDYLKVDFQRSRIKPRIRLEERSWFNRDLPWTEPNVTLTEANKYANKGIPMQVALHRLFSFCGPAQYSAELEIERNVGSVLCGFFEVPGTAITSGQEICYPPVLRPFGRPAKPDITTTSYKTPWAAVLPIVTLIGECKQDSQNDDVRAQLAFGAQPTLLMLALRYLVTRRTVYEQYPPWFFVYGLYYDQNGIEVYAHWPKIEIDPKTSKPRWGYVQVSVLREQSRCFADAEAGVSVTVAHVLLCLQAHANFLARQFSQWTNESSGFMATLKRHIYSYREEIRAKKRGNSDNSMDMDEPPKRKGKSSKSPHNKSKAEPSPSQTNALLRQLLAQGPVSPGQVQPNVASQNGEEWCPMVFQGTQGAQDSTEEQTRSLTDASSSLIWQASTEYPDVPLPMPGLATPPDATEQSRECLKGLKRPVPERVEPLPKRNRTLDKGK